MRLRLTTRLPLSRRTPCWEGVRRRGKGVGQLGFCFAQRRQVLPFAPYLRRPQTAPSFAARPSPQMHGSEQSGPPADRRDEDVVAKHSRAAPVSPQARAPAAAPPAQTNRLG
jgi:hypothetical protein